MYSFVEAIFVSLQKEYISRLKQTQNPNSCATFVRISPHIHTTLQHFVSSATRSKCSNIQSHGRGFRWRRHWLNVKTEGLETSILLQYDWYKAYSNSSSLKIILIYSSQLYLYTSRLYKKLRLIRSSIETARGNRDTPYTYIN